jgi:hypothetical protein
MMLMPIGRSLAILQRQRWLCQCLADDVHTWGLLAIDRRDELKPWCSVEAPACEASGTPRRMAAAAIQRSPSSSVSRAWPICLHRLRKIAQVVIILSSGRITGQLRDASFEPSAPQLTPSGAQGPYRPRPNAPPTTVHSLELLR